MMENYEEGGLVEKLGLGDGSVTLWNAELGLMQTNLLAHRRGVAGVAFTPDGRTMATAGEEGTAKLWNVAAQREIVTLRGHLRSLHAIDISSDGRRLATGSGGAEALKLWDMQTHQELITLSSDGTLMMGLAFSPDGNKIIGRDLDKESNGELHLQIWRAPSWAEIDGAEAKERKQP